MKVKYIYNKMKCYLNIKIRRCCTTVSEKIFYRDSNKIDTISDTVCNVPITTLTKYIYMVKLKLWKMKKKCYDHKATKTKYNYYVNGI